MQSIFLKIDNDLSLMAIPDTQAHLDGHPVLTYTYSIFKNPPTTGNFDSQQQDQLIQPDKKTNPDYMGTLTFEQPDKLFSYEADGLLSLSSDEVQQIIEQLTHHRENPNLWAINANH